MPETVDQATLIVRDPFLIGVLTRAYACGNLESWASQVGSVSVQNETGAQASGALEDSAFVEHTGS